MANLTRHRWLAVSLACALVQTHCSQGPAGPDGSTTEDGSSNGDVRNDLASDQTAPERDGTNIDAEPSADADLAITALTVTPASATLTITDRMVRQRQRFVAMGRLADGSTVPVSAAWSVDRPEVLTIDAMGESVTTNNSAGDVVVTARYGGQSATATVRVTLDFAIVLPGAPPGTEMAFAPGAMPTMDNARTSTWVYPANETVFPQNLHRVLFQWRPAGNDRFRINFESDRLRLSLYASGVHPTCTSANNGVSCFEPELDIWRLIAASNPRASVRITIDSARSSDPGRFYRSAPLSIGFSRGPVPGAIYYWSTTAEGVRRATVEDARPANFLTPDETDGRCVACHTLSRRGNRLGADVGGHNLWIV
ncbi:MAG: hypothetical protein Q8Q09_16885 [Deltaproteobacteria bacterium]|nr:hypothetical protein [Deltaproteobacteria bacterium]